MIKEFDDALFSIQKSFDSWIQDVKLVFSNFPEVFSKFSLTISNMIEKFFSYDNVKTLALAFVNFIPKAFESALKRAASVLDLFLKTKTGFLLVAVGILVLNFLGIFFVPKQYTFNNKKEGLFSSF